MEEVRSLLKRIVAGEGVDPASLENFVRLGAEGKLDPVLAGAVLTALAVRGVGSGELMGVVRGLYSVCAVDEEVSDAIDTCGTGGSGIPKYNYSSAVALSLWAMGYKVAKHGNRSMTSKVGSADVFFHLGWPQDLPSAQAVDCLKREGFAFLYAPAFFPSMKNFAPVRRALGIRTVFNLAGPLSNPVRVGRQVVGVSDESLMPVFAQVLAELGRSAMIVHSRGGMDEALPFEDFRVVLVRNGRMVEDRWCKPKEVLGDYIEDLDWDRLHPSSSEDNYRMLESFLRGTAPKEFLAVVALNAGLGVWLIEGLDLRSSVERVLDFLESNVLEERWQGLIRSLRVS